MLSCVSTASDVEADTPFLAPLLTVKIDKECGCGFSMHACCHWCAFGDGSGHERAIARCFCMFVVAFLKTSQDCTHEWFLMTWGQMSNFTQQMSLTHAFQGEMCFEGEMCVSHCLVQLKTSFAWDVHALNSIKHWIIDKKSKPS